MKHEAEHKQELLEIDQHQELQEKRSCYDEKPYDYWLEKHHYYYHRLKKLYRFLVPEGARVLDIQCRNGYLLDAVNPAVGVGIDTNAAFIHQARERYARHTFLVGGVADLIDHEPFDYILVSHALAHTDCVQTLLQSLKSLCHARTRIIIDLPNPWYRPLASLAHSLGIIPYSGYGHWLSSQDLQTLVYLTDYEVVSVQPALLLPVYIPFISTLCNLFLSHLPLVQRLCMQQTIVMRPLCVERDPQGYTVSVIVPCRNEKGNIEAAITRTPLMGRFTELIFVEGNSHDGTLDEIYRLMRAYPERSISVYQQKGKGKGDAVRLGFEQALGEIVMILDADLTVEPEELATFYRMLLANKGDFINGSRLVYRGQAGAMPWLNTAANIFFGRLCSWIMRQRVKDSLCGTKVLWKEDYRLIARNRSFFGTIDPFGDFDLLFGAAKHNLKIVDLPVHYKKRTYGTTNIRHFYSGWVLFAMSLLAIKKFKLY